MLESSKVEQKATNGIKSQGRVKEFGEVFTPDKTVNDMLDLTDKCFEGLGCEEYVSKTYLEPACGDGQFLIRVLYRKLEKIANSSLDIDDKEKLLIKALSSIYGVDIQEDNVKEARNRMYNLVLGNNIKTFDLGGITKNISIDIGIEIRDKVKDIVRKILEHNIITGNTLIAFEHYKKPTEGEEVRLIEYRFEGDKVKAWRNTLHTDFTSDETDWFNIDKIYEIMDNKASEGDEIEDFDSF